VNKFHKELNLVAKGCNSLNTLTKYNKVLKTQRLKIQKAQKKSGKKKVKDTNDSSESGSTSSSGTLGHLVHLLEVPVLRSNKNKAVHMADNVILMGTHILKKNSMAAKKLSTSTTSTGTVPTSSMVPLVTKTFKKQKNKNATIGCKILASTVGFREKICEKQKIKMLL
jgi:hypothetical protein